MKTAITTLVVLVVLFSTGPKVHAESESAGRRPSIGVMIDPAPLGGLLGKHLGLAEDQGLRIQNVLNDSPADQAGLERDDLIIGFEGDDVRGYEGFVDAIHKAGSGTEVSLEIIHLGVRKTVKLTLKPHGEEPTWKYPREPEAVQSWRPGRFFRLERGDEDWKEMFKDGIPPDIDVDVKKFFNEVRTYHFSNGEDFTVTIEGNPRDEDSTVSVRIGDEEHTSNVKGIDKLPKKFREAAEDALEKAKKEPDSRKRFYRRFDVDSLPWETPPDWKGYFDKLNPRNYNPMPHIPLPHRDEMFDRIQKQMREMRKRLEELEERHGEILDRFSGERDEKKPEEKDESVRPTGEDLLET